MLSLLIPLSIFTFATAIFLAKNPVYGVLSFVIVVLHIVMLLILLNLELLAYTLAIVYIGAIVVLFLFVIMMFYVRENRQPRSFIRGATEYWILGVIVSLLLFYYTFFCLYEHIDYAPLITEKQFANLLSYTLFNDLFLLTVVVALLLLVGVIGSVLLTIKQPLITRVSPPKVRASVRESIKKKRK